MHIFWKQKQKRSLFHQLPFHSATFASHSLSSAVFPSTLHLLLLLPALFTSAHTATTSMTASTPLFDMVNLSNTKNAISVQLLKFPCTDAPLLDKVQAFAYFKEVIHQHSTQLNSTAQAYTNNIPVSSSSDLQRSKLQ
jgi:hypothetical protein